MDKKSLSSLLDNISIGIIVGILFLFPLLFSPFVSDVYVLPKQLLVLVSAIILVVVWAIKLILIKKVVFHSNPINLSLFLFGVVVLASALFSQNRYDSLFQSVPLILLIVLSFLLMNLLDKKDALKSAIYSIILGAVFSSIISILYFLHIYILPFGNPNNPLFTTFGSPIQHMGYLLPIFLLSGAHVIKKMKENNYEKFASDSAGYFHLASSFFLLAGISLNIHKIFFAQDKPVTLPIQYGIQIATAAIGQDTQRQLPSLLFGSGFGTFLTDFTRFKPISFNLESQIWNLNIGFSTSLVLEFIATTGILGIISFGYIVFKTVKNISIFEPNPLTISLIAVIALMFVIPYSFTFVFLFFILLSFYVALLRIDKDKRIFLVSLSLVRPQDGLFSLNATGEKENGSYAFPIVLAILVLIPLLTIGIYSTKYLQSDIKFKKAQDPEMLKNGQLTYDIMRDAIAIFPYRDDYFRLFSQINLSLANNISQQVKSGQQPTAEMQQTVFSLLQQSINAARSAVVVSPLTVSNWTNLGKIYRTLVSVGRNAEQFALASYQEAIKLNPYDPQNYIETGGIFYQLGQYDAAIIQFQNAVTLKPDLANSHYNLGHAFESKGEFEKALDEYEEVKKLTQQNNESIVVIEKEIATIQDKISKKSGKTKVEPIQNNTPNVTVGAEEQLTIPGPPSEQNSTQSTTPTPEVTQPTEEQ